MFHHQIMPLKVAKGVANSVDQDQGAVSFCQGLSDRKFRIITVVQ